MSRFASPLRYPGGKAKLLGFVQELLRANRLLGSHYVEPYAGGAGLALSLLFLEYADTVHLNDIDKSVFFFWKAVLETPDGLCRKIRDTKVSIEQWNRQRSIHAHPENHSDLDVGFAAFFLNRTNRSGIIKGGGMIGGSSQTGKWKLDARFNKPELIRRIKQISTYSSRITLHNLDAERFLQKKVSKLPKNTFVYLDPPYLEKGPRLYEKHYKFQDHERVAQLVQDSIAHQWIVSYDDHSQIRSLYRHRRWRTYSVGYSAARKYQGSEIMFFSDALRIPFTAR